jgi:hypothetical protein
MSLSGFKTALTSQVGVKTLLVRKHSPAMLFGIGAVGFITTAVLASRATLKMDAVLREAEEKNEKIKAALELKDKDYTEEDAKKDGITTRVQLAIKVAKLYAPAVLVGTLTLGALTGSHVILSRRNAGLTAAYAVVDKSFKQYRGRVVDELGKDKDEEFLYGVVEKEVAVDTDDGVAVKTIKTVDHEKVRKNGKSMYARYFERGNVNWQPTMGHNATFIRIQQQWANDMLMGNGYIFLNEVYKMLGLEPTPAGQLVGWVKGNGDDYIDFGILDDPYEGMRFVSGDEASVLLDFNVDGVVWDLIGSDAE